MELHRLIPDAQAMLDLEPEELAGYLLEFLSSPDGGNSLNRHNIGLPHVVEGYPRHFQTQLSEAILEAWMFLEREGFVAPSPGGGGDWYFITRRGKRVAGHVNFTALQKANALPRGRLQHFGTSMGELSSRRLRYRCLSGVQGDRDRHSRCR